MRRIVSSAFLMLAPLTVPAQTISGVVGGVTPSTELISATFSCTGTSPCTGTHTFTSLRPGCSNPIIVSSSFVATGFNATTPGPISGSMTFRLADADVSIGAGGACTGSNYRDYGMDFTGHFDGAIATFSVAEVENGVPYTLTGGYGTQGGPPAPPPPPVFPMVVTGSIGPVVSNIRADIQFRTQDLGSNQSIYVFAVAPQNVVQASAAAAADMPPLAKALPADGSKADAPVACVLAQLNSAGRLQQVSASSMQAFVTGVLTSAGASIQVLNGTATVNIAGSTFYIGYGTTAQSMLSGGINRNVVPVPGTAQCRPGPPQKGWWWYPAEDGRGYSIEVAGRNIFYASFLYDDAGRSKWYVATGATSLDGSLFTGDLLEVLSGQTLFDAYRAPSTPRSVGPITLAFNSPSTGTQVWPGGTIPIERFAIVPNGLTAPAQANVPESGWWWNPDESGRGFFIEFQNGSVDIAGYMYDDAGNAVWYLTVLPTPNPRQWSGSWWTFGGGQTLTGAWRPNTQTSNNFAPLSITFDSATTATLTLPGGRSTRLVRHRF